MKLISAVLAAAITLSTTAAFAQSSAVALRQAALRQCAGRDRRCRTIHDDGNGMPAAPQLGRMPPVTRRETARSLPRLADQRWLRRTPAGRQGSS